MLNKNMLNKNLTIFNASLLIIFANMLTSGYSNYVLSHQVPVERITYYVLFFTLFIGWGGLMYQVKTDRVLLSSIAITAVSNAYLLYKEMKFTTGESQETYRFTLQDPKIEFLVYIIGFLAFTYFIPNSSDAQMSIQTKRKYTLLMAIVIMFCQLVGLPFERRDRFVDGPSYVCLTIAWMVLSKFISERKTN